MLSIKQSGIEFIFWVFGMTRPISRAIGNHSNYKAISRVNFITAR